MRCGLWFVVGNWWKVEVLYVLNSSRLVPVFVFVVKLFHCHLGFSEVIVLLYLCHFSTKAGAGRGLCLISK